MTEVLFVQIAGRKKGISPHLYLQHGIIQYFHPTKRRQYNTDVDFNAFLLNLRRRRVNIVLEAPCRSGFQPVAVPWSQIAHL
jgi:hypothetical protein